MGVALLRAPGVERQGVRVVVVLVGEVDGVGGVVLRRRERKNAEWHVVRGSLGRMLVC